MARSLKKGPFADASLISPATRVLLKHGPAVLLSSHPS